MAKKLRSNRFLPQYVTRFKSQHGTVRHRFRRNGFKGGYFEAQLGTEEFRQEYQAFMNPGAAAKPVMIVKAKPGTLDEALNRYMAVPERLGPTAVTQGKITAVLEDFRQGRGDRPVKLVTFEAIDKIISKKKVKTGSGNKTKGGIHAAHKLRKELIRFFDFCVKAGLCEKNPAQESQSVTVPVAQKTGGFHSWTESEIQQYRDYHKLGSKARLAMELYLWTDQRRSDVHRMGRNQIQNGRIPVTQAKTGKMLWVALAPQLLEAIIAVPADQTSPFCFIVSNKGTAYTKESFGNWFKDMCVEAGLPHCTGHGLRKATLRRLADLEMSNKSMKSLSGQTNDKTLAGYIEDTNQKKLADSAITALARWEMSATPGGHDDEYRFTAND